MHFKHPSFTAAKAVRALLADAIATTWDEYFDGNHSANAYSPTKPDSRGAPGQGPKEKAVGQLKDMAARTLLLKLHQLGLLALPPRRQLPTNRMRCPSQRPVAGEVADHPLDCALAQLGR